MAISFSTLHPNFIFLLPFHANHHPLVSKGGQPLPIQVPSRELKLETINHCWFFSITIKLKIVFYSSYKWADVYLLQMSVFKGKKQQQRNPLLANKQKVIAVSLLQKELCYWWHWLSVPNLYQQLVSLALQSPAKPYPQCNHISLGHLFCPPNKEAMHSLHGRDYYSFPFRSISHNTMRSSFFVFVLVLKSNS